MSKCTEDFLIENDEPWTAARYEAALDQVGGTKARGLGAITVFMIGARWGRDYAKNPRPLTADPHAITRVLDVFVEAGWVDEDDTDSPDVTDVARNVITAALTPPPTLEAIVDEALTKYTGGYLNGDEVGPWVASKYAATNTGAGS